jgi:copper transport protein
VICRSAHPWSKKRRRGVLGACWRSLGLLMLAVVIAACLPASPASAHATLLFTSPAVDGAVPDSPPVVQLVFDQSVVASQSSLRVASSLGDAARVGEVQTAEESSVLRAQVLERLAPGEYRVEWQVVARDGDTMVGDFRFVVGSGAGLASEGGGAATRGGWAVGGLRWLLFLGLALGLGGLAGARIVRRASSAVDAPMPWLKAGAGVGLVASAGLAVLVAGAGSFEAGLDPARLGDLVESSPGLVATVQVMAFASALGGFSVGWGRAGGVLLLAVPVAEGFRGHPQAQAGVLGVGLVAVHLVAVALWVGALLHVIRTSIALRRAHLPSAKVVRGYARMALVLFLVVFATGTLAALAVLPLDDLNGALLDTTYGRWLLVKVGFVAVVVALAWWARRHIRRGPEAAQPALSARAELGVLAGVLAVSSALTVLAPPVSANIPLAFPPPDAGPAIALGTRTGYVGIGVSASQGQVVVKLSTPNTADSEGRSQDAVDLTGNLAGNGGTARSLQFRRCGLGCFAAPASWVRGENVVTLRVDDERWGGGRAAVQVAWPPRPEDQRLAAVVAQMRKVEHFTLHEQVTSDTATGLGPRMRLRITGEEYLAAGPFGSGRAATVTRYQVHRGGEVTLSLGYPAESVYVLLTVDRRNRIVREVLTSGEHLVTRTLVYNEPDSHEGHRHESG